MRFRALTVLSTGDGGGGEREFFFLVSLKWRFRSWTLYLCFRYSSEANARAALQIGIPVLEMHRNGIIFSFNRPHEFDDFDSRFYPSNEAVLAVIVPSRLLSRLPSELEGSSKHRILSGDILKALRFPPNQESSGSYFTNKFVYLPPRLIVRALQNNWRKATATKSAQMTPQMPPVLIEVNLLNLVKT